MNVDVVLKPSEIKRLNDMRKNSRMWIKRMAEARDWDNAFLLKIIDRFMRRGKGLGK